MNGCENMVKDLFVFCPHCGELVDVNSEKKNQLKYGKIVEYPWGIRSSNVAREELKKRGSIVRIIRVPSN